MICVLRSEEKFAYSSARKLILLLFSFAVLCFYCEVKGIGMLISPRTEDEAALGVGRGGGRQRDSQELISPH